jgi:hypothetical protein
MEEVTARPEKRVWRRFPGPRVWLRNESRRRPSGLKGYCGGGPQALESG